MKILVLSDIHGNWAALQAVLEAEPDAERILCLGDLVNYGPQPVECVSWAMQLRRPHRVLQGNHDLAFGSSVEALAPSAEQRLAETTQAATAPLLAPEMTRFLAGLEPLQRFGAAGASCVVCHALPSDPLYGHLINPNAFNLWESEIIAAGHPDILFVGHTHVPLRIQFQRTLVVNPGSVGFPRDGDPRAAYAVWQDDTVTLRRVSYPLEETARALAALDLEEHILNRLLGQLSTGGQTELANT